jgi:hypothetical protein
VTPPVLLVGALRIGVVGLIAYLAVIATLALLARWSRGVRVEALTTLLTPTLLRRAATAFVGAAIALPAAASADEPAADPPVLLHRLPDPEVSPTTTTTVDVPEPAPTEATAVPDATVDAAATWTVAPGENFWAIARAVLSREWQRAPSNAEIVPYWRELIEINRDRLRDPANADLIYPAQEFTLPAPPVAD